MKRTLNKTIIIFTSTIFVIILILIGIILIQKFYCKHWGDRYSLNSPCHDPNYRCQIECSNYGLNFTGEIDGCMCDCGNASVSVCSGFLTLK